MIYSFDTIETVHLEITSKCNASCPMCGRNKFGGPDNENLPLTELSLADVKQMFSEKFVKQLKRLYMCGNYGDPIAANDTLEVFEWLRSVNPKIKLGLHTNASARNPTWWTKLGTIMNGPWDYVKFGIDGLADTNHLYRRGTSWQKIMDNAAAFIAAGGNAQWEFIVFKHNEHQIAAAQELSDNMGFKQFRTKKTGRFFSNTKLEGKDTQEVWNRKGEVEYFIEKPSMPEYQNQSLMKETDIVASWGSMERYVDKTAVSCKVIADKSIYISAEGLAFPCCWTANQLYVWYWKPKTSEIWKLIDYDIDNVSALTHDLETIVNGEYFKKIYDSWYKPSVSDGKLRVCAKTCGNSFDQFASQFK